MTQRNLSLWALLICVAIMTGCSGMPKTIDNFPAIQKEIDTVTVMPSTATVFKESAFKVEGIALMTADIEKELKDAAEAIIAAGDLDLHALDTSDAALAADPELRRHIGDLASPLKEAQAGINAVGNQKTIAIPFEGNLDYFADRTDTDYFLFLQVDGYFRSTGSKVKEVAVMAVFAGLFGGVPQGRAGSAIIMDAYLVDANRGHVLWYNHVAKRDWDPRKPSHLFKTCQDLLKPLIGEVPLKADKSRDDVIKDKYKDLMEEIEAAQQESREAEAEARPERAGHDLR